MNLSEIEEKVRLALKEIKGVLCIKILSQEEKEKILKLEQEAEKKVLYGMGKGLNTGLREILKREIIVAIANDNEFEWPPEPAIQIVCNNEVIGEEIKSPEKAKEYERQGHIVSGNLVIFRDKTQSIMSRKDFTVVFPPMSFKQLEGIDEFTDVMSASPCPPSHLFISECMNANNAPGTILVGFNIKKKG
ncbi:MAG: hypothetical protein H3Z52_01010 [archaeon]|nr:hypothetical protein [archaeon]MCP8318128.1 hypothetical protein [archaeon]MCP8319511.1 hypothetical protein [archaeon]